MSKHHRITITGQQLLDALSLITGDGPRRDLTEEELETEIDIEEKGKWRDPEDGIQPAGLYASLSEYPEEGLYGPLGNTHEAKRIAKKLQT